MAGGNACAEQKQGRIGRTCVQWKPSDGMAHERKEQEAAPVPCWHVRIRFQQHDLVGPEEMATPNLNSDSPAWHREGGLSSTNNSPDHYIFEIDA